MLSKALREAIEKMDRLNPNYRRTVRKRVLDNIDQTLDDVQLLLSNAEKFPELKKKITPEKIQKIIDAYFQTYNVDIKFSDPDKIIDLLSENVVLKRKNADLLYELSNMVHRVEHFKYIAEHVSNMNSGASDEEAVAP